MNRKKVYILQDMITNIVVALINVLLVAIVAYIGKLATDTSKSATKVNKALSLVEALAPIAEAAVTVAEQKGALNGWTGAKENEFANALATKALSNLGFSTADQATISNAVEHAWATLKDTLENAYGKSASAVNDEKLAQANEKLADAQAQVAKAQAINDAVQKAIATATPVVPESSASNEQPVATPVNTTESTTEGTVTK